MFRPHVVIIRLMPKTYEGSIHIVFWKRGLASYNLCDNPVSVHFVQGQNLWQWQLKLKFKFKNLKIF